MDGSGRNCLVSQSWYLYNFLSVIANVDQEKRLALYYRKERAHFSHHITSLVREEEVFALSNNTGTNLFPTPHPLTKRVPGLGAGSPSWTGKEWFGNYQTNLRSRFF